MVDAAAADTPETSWAAYCDACLIGSPVITFDLPHLARAWAVQRLGGMGWLHVLPASHAAFTRSGREMAETSWTGETYCFECAGNLRMRRQA